VFLFAVCLHGVRSLVVISYDQAGVVFFCAVSS